MVKMNVKNGGSNATTSVPEQHVMVNIPQKPQRPAEHVNRNTELSDKTRCCLIGWGICVGILALLLLAILLPLSYNGVNYNQCVFKRNEITQEIDWDSGCYPYGTYFWGVAVTNFPFNLNVTKVTLNNLSVITSSGLQFSMSVAFYYRLNISSIHELFINFGGNGYNAQIQNLATGFIKNKAPSYTINDYMTNRFYIQHDMENGLRTILTENNVIMDQGAFFLLEITLPPNVISQNLETSIQAQNTITAEYTQNQTAIVQETNYLVSLYTNNITYIQRTTSAQVNTIVSNANSYSYNILQSAQGQGLQYLLNSLSITNTTTINTVMRVMAYLSKHPVIIVGDGINIFLNP